MNKFKVGDKVRCIKSISEVDGGPRQGEEFIVTSADENHIGFVIPAYRHSYGNKKIRDGLTTNWGVSCFELAQETKIKHYKWQVEIWFADISGGVTIIQEVTPHYVSEKRIQDYIMFRVNEHKGYHINSSYHKLDDIFVEDVE